MQISVTGDLGRSLNIAKKLQGLRKGLWEDVRSVSFELEKNIKVQAPVDTGRARSSWGHWVNMMEKENDDAGPNDAYWKEDEYNLRTEQGSNLAYFPALRAGHSMQRPYDWVALYHKKAQKVLARKVRQRVRSAGFK